MKNNKRVGLLKWRFALVKGQHGVIETLKDCVWRSSKCLLQQRESRGLHSFSDSSESYRILASGGEQPSQTYKFALEFISRLVSKITLHYLFFFFYFHVRVNTGMGVPLQIAGQQIPWS